MNKDIVAAIEYLNQKTGRKFKTSKKSTGLIAARLRSFSLPEIKIVIDAKCSEWMGDEKMQKYLQPSTLFNKTNFEKYLVSAAPVKDETLSPLQIEHREYLKTPVWQKKREKVMQRTNHCCEGCGAYIASFGQVHHLHYNNWKDEFLFDLVYLCNECHGKIHTKR